MTLPCYQKQSSRAEQNNEPNTMDWLVKYVDMSQVVVGQVAAGVPQVDASGLDMSAGMSARYVEFQF